MKQEAPTSLGGSSSQDSNDKRVNWNDVMITKIKWMSLQDNFIITFQGAAIPLFLYVDFIFSFIIHI